MMRKEEQKRLEAILEKLKTEILPFPEPDNSERKKLASEDFFYFFDTYLPHYKEHKFTNFHKELFEFINIKTNPPSITVIAAPRGFAKSTICSFAYVLWCILFRKRNFIVIFSATDELSTNIVDFIRIELIYNKRIEMDFGKLLTSKNTANDFIANGVRVFSRSIRQMARGFRFRQHRPDLIICDDIETDETAKSNKSVKKLLNVITSGIYPALAPEGHLFIIGTIIKRKSALGEILLNTDAEKPWHSWKKKIYKALNTDENGNYYSLWEDRFSTKTLLNIKDSIGTIDFNREYQNTPDEESNIFCESWFQFYDTLPEGLSIATFVDPSVETAGDYKAVITVGLDRQTSRYYVIEAWVKKTSIDSMLSKIFDTYIKYKPDIIGFEANGFQKVLESEFRLFCKTKGVIPPTKLVTHTRSKHERILKLSPLVERGVLLLKHLKTANDDTPILYEQMIFFPDSDYNDDAPDALEGAISLLEKYTYKTEFQPVRKRLVYEIMRGW